MVSLECDPVLLDAKQSHFCELADDSRMTVSLCYGNPKEDDDGSYFILQP